jgi:hypothetical protein
MYKRAASERTPEADFYQPILVAVESLGGRAQRKQVLSWLNSNYGRFFTDEDRRLLPSGKKRIRWEFTASYARKHLIDRGLLIDAGCGCWQITQLGLRRLQLIRAAA